MAGVRPDTLARVSAVKKLIDGGMGVTRALETEKLALDTYRKYEDKAMDVPMEVVTLNAPSEKILRGKYEAKAKPGGNYPVVFVPRSELANFLKEYA